MSKYSPKDIEKRLQKLHDQYLEGVENLAQEVMDHRLSEYLTRKGLSFCVMNGFAECYDKNGDPQELPVVVYNLYNVRDPEGNLFMYSLPDFNPFEQDFSDLNIQAFNKRMDGITEQEAVLSCFQTFNLTGV